VTNIVSNTALLALKHSPKVWHVINWTFITLLLMFSQTLYANLSVQADRDRITDAELLKVTVRFDNPASIQSPEWRNVSRDFDVISQSGPSQNKSVRIVNGQQSSENYVVWELSLRPKRLGTLSIPPLTMGGFTSAAIPIQVTRASAAVKRRLNEFVFFDTTIDTNTAYVQGQIIYTIKLFYLDSISGEFPPPPALDNAIVEIIENEKRYDAILNNRRYYVLEKRYAIYPQRSGKLTLPAETFAGTRGSRGFFSKGQQVVAVSDQHTIDVKPKPAAFTGSEWLPAKSLELSEAWATNPPKFTLGEPINRILFLKVDGLASSLLPPFENLDITNAKIYKDPPNKEQVTSADGIQSVLTTTIGIVPTQAGTITIPEIEIPWWNTETDLEEVAILPKMTFEVSPGAQNGVTVPVIQPPPRPDVSTDQTINDQPVVITESANTIWIILTVVSSLAAVFMTFMWWNARSNSNPSNKDSERDSRTLGLLSESKLFETFKKCCKNNDAMGARNALFFWAKLRYPDINSNRDIARHMKDQTQIEAVIAELSLLEAAIYSKSPNSDWQGASLLKQISAIHDQSSAQAKTTAMVPSLNPG
jgi:hypothetical protein